MASFRRLTPRETWLVAGLILVAGVVGALYSIDWNSRQASRYAVAAADRADADQLRLATERLAAARPDRAALAEIADGSLQARDVWLARLAIEQRLLRTAASAHVAQPAVTVAQAVEGDPAAPVLRSELSGSWTGHVLPALIKALTSEQPAPIIQALHVGPDPAPGFKLTLLFPVQFTGGAN